MKIVIKVGTSALTAGGKTLSQKHMLEIVRQIADIHSLGHQAVLVSSGAVAAGREILQNAFKENSLPDKQMLSSVGQVHLMHLWKELFGIYCLSVGQLLLTRGDFSQREGYLNVRNTLESLLHHRVIPIINENDSVATNEIQFGDNDNIAALVANLIAADQLLLLTDTEGLYTADPSLDPTARLIEDVHSIDDSLLSLAGKTTKSKGMGSGGMLTKVEAALLATRSGTATIIASSKQLGIISKIVAGNKAGTRFHAQTTPKESRKRWLLSERPHGVLTVDKGAMDTLRKKGSSLLPVGILAADGTFIRGAIVEVRSESGERLARGIVNYSSRDISQILGTHSEKIETILGYSYGLEVIHRGNMALL